MQKILIDYPTVHGLNWPKSCVMLACARAEEENQEASFLTPSPAATGVPITPGSVCVHALRRQEDA